MVVYFSIWSKNFGPFEMKSAKKTQNGEKSGLHNIGAKAEYQEFLEELKEFED